jgi:hypothetical protein
MTVCNSLLRVPGRALLVTDKQVCPLVCNSLLQALSEVRS